MSDRRPLVIGATGQVGTAFVRLLEDCEQATRERLDLAQVTPEEVKDLLRRVDPSVVVNCAAYTAVDRAEEEEEMATRVNGKAVGWLAEATAALDIPLLTYSTDYVFDGEGTSPYLESHPTDPINAYGRSKLVGERAALAANPAALIVRTSWVLSSTHRNFVTAILGRAKEGKSLTVVDDQVGCPTIADDLAAASWNAINLGASGFLHLTNQGETTWYRLAREAVERAGLDPSAVEACTTDEYPTPARRPSYSVLGSEVTADLGLQPLPDWRDSIDPVVAGSLSLIGG